MADANPNPINVTCIDHVVIRAKDIDAMIAFYTSVLGCRLERSLDEFGLFQLRAGSALIDLVDVNAPLGLHGGGPPDPDARNMDHFCLMVTPWDEPAIKAHLSAHGIDVSEEGIRYGAAGNGPSVYIQDPEGNTVELKGVGI